MRSPRNAFTDPSPRTPTPPDAQTYVERMRDRSRSRQAPIHDWRLTLLPAAIKAGMPARALRLCAALCDHQRGRSFYPEVIVGLDQLATELGVLRHHVIQDEKKLVQARLLSIISGGGRLAGSRTGRANVYQLGEGLTVPAEVRLTVPGRVLYSRTARTPNSTSAGTPNPSGYTVTVGGSGDRTAALTGGPTPSQPSPASISPSRFRDLLERTGLRKRSVANAL